MIVKDFKKCPYFRDGFDNVEECIVCGNPVCPKIKKFNIEEQNVKEENTPTPVTIIPNALRESVGMDPINSDNNKPVKITLRELLDIVEVPVVISEEDFGGFLMVLNQLDFYSSEDFKYILAPEFLDREVYRLKTQDNNILVALKEVE